MSITGERESSLKIKDFIEKVRACKKCMPDVEPLIAGSSNSKIFVVSERPPDKKTHEEFGKYWKKDGLIPVFGACTMLGIVDELNTKNFFWMHTANCYKGKQKKCSENFLEDGIRLVNPKLILIFGKDAAHFFFPTKKFKDVIGLGKWDKYDCAVLPHFSSAARKWHKTYENKVEGVKKKVKKILSGISE